MAIGKMKRKTDSISKPVALWMARAGISPNTLTGIGLFLILVAGYFLYLGHIRTGCVFILGAGLFDLLDGAVARHGNKSTKFGGYLDSLADRYADVILFTAVIAGGHIDDFLGLPGILWGVIALAGAILTSYSRALSEARGKPMSGIGLFERPERLLVFCVFGFIGRLTYGIIILAFMGHITVIQRAAYFYNTNRDK